MAANSSKKIDKINSGLMTANGSWHRYCTKINVESWILCRYCVGIADIMRELPTLCGSRWYCVGLADIVRESCGNRWHCAGIVDIVPESSTLCRNRWHCARIAYIVPESPILCRNRRYCDRSDRHCRNSRSRLVSLGLNFFFNFFKPFAAIRQKKFLQFF